MDDVVIAFVEARTQRFLLVLALLCVVPWVCSARAHAFTEPGIKPGIPGSWADFANCPVMVVILLSPLPQCDHSYTTSGVIQIGHSIAPISIPGDTFDLGITSVGNGIAISPPHGLLNGPAQPAPGGLLGAVGDTQLTGVSAKLEWAAPVPPNAAFGFTEACGGVNPLVTFDQCRLLGNQQGTVVTLKAKLHLMSSFLGASCYIGSAAQPIVIALTTGVTTPPPPALPIHGKTLEFLYSLGSFQQAVGIRLVGNSFSVPVATGCGTSGGNLVNASINHRLGLPSPPGQNMIAINADAEQAPAKEVLAHGWTGE
jgi:hypothetical protein